jgi:hypothetical protein
VKTSSLLPVAALVVFVGCSSSPRSEETATIRLALTQVPADVACVRITVAGSRTVVRAFPTMPGQGTTFTIGGLPLGKVTVRGDAFREMCQAVADASVPPWVSEPLPADLSVERVTIVTLIFQRNGRLIVVGDFQDDPDGGAPAGAPDAAPAPDVSPACPMNCDDGIACTVDTCETQTAACTHTPDDQLCAGGPNTVGRCGPMGCTLSCVMGFSDCNGNLVMDGCEANLASDPRNCGACGLACAMGDVCQGGMCVRTCMPSPEVCNGRDDDCDGMVDEGNPGGGGACNTGLPGVCSQGSVTCTNGALACRQNLQPTAEVCNGMDDNCNGTVDEGNPGGGAACNTGRPGICAQGTVLCLGGALACNQIAQPRTETCNNLDDDCDGAVDEGCP